jgi:hypothetical protein
MRTLLLIFPYIFLFLNICAQEYPEMIYIAGGPFTLGSNVYREDNITYDEFGNSRYLYEEVDAIIDAFEISRTEITVEQFSSFVEQTGYQTVHQRLDGKGDQYWEGFSEKSDYPMFYITPFDAIAYCQWLSDVTGEVYRLPSEAEWEMAARGDSENRYPWGNDFRSIVEINEIDPLNPHFKVDQYPQDTTSTGLNGMLSGAEVTLDVFAYRDPSVREIHNPLSTSGSELVQKGNYNGYYIPGMGYFARNGASFMINVSRNYTFRVVREINRTIFNLNQEHPSQYFTGLGTVQSDYAPIRFGPDTSYNMITTLEQNMIAYITLKSETETGVWYRVYIQKTEPFIENTTIEKGYLGWVHSSDISLKSDNWYEQ